MPASFSSRRSVITALVTMVIAWTVWSALPALRAADPPAVQFVAPVMFDTGEALPVDTERADLNGDGIQDLAVLTTQGGGKVQMLLGQPGAGGTAQLLKDNTITVPYGSGVATGDLNGDGLLDLVVTQTANKTAADGICGLASGTVVMLGLGGTTPLFGPGTCLEPLSNHYLTDAAVADFNHDGRADIVVTDDNRFGLTFYRGNGDGTVRYAWHPRQRLRRRSAHGPARIRPADRGGHEQ